MLPYRSHGVTVAACHRESHSKMFPEGLLERERFDKRPVEPIIVAKSTLNCGDISTFLQDLIQIQNILDSVLARVGVVSPGGMPAQKISLDF